ncbi:MAG: CapA family protein [Alistipes sp.]|nr:CapA family protein [Alistipes sp.]
MKRLIYILLAVPLCVWFVLEASPAIRYAAEAPESEPEVKCDTVRLVFGGDLMQHMPQVSAARSADGSYDYTRSFEYVAHYFRDADVAVINLETTLSPDGHYSGYPCFCSPVEVADAMADMGIDVAVMANNHCCDRASRGIASTVEALERRAIRHTGVYADSADYRRNNILRFEHGGVRFAMINYTYGTNGIPVPGDRIVNLIDTLVISRDMAAIDRDSVDCIIAFMHWGNEYERRANAEQRRLADFLRRHAADIVIGSHPHVIQPFEVDSAGVVFYSLGNFVSNQQRRYCDGGLIASVDVIRCDTLSRLQYAVEAIPVWVLCPGYRILPPEVADTICMPDDARRRYEQFVSDTNSLLYL